jgi:hypothetical protein
MYMSANWSITYVEKTITDDEFFKAMQEAFRINLEDKLYGLRWADNQELEPFKLGESIHERFSDSKRAKLLLDGLMNELYGHGILHFPQRNSLHVIVDSIIRLNIYLSGRLRREELKTRLQSQSDPIDEVVFHFMNFLQHLTKTLQCHAVHVMFERNPATRATSVHFYDSGEFVDSYYYENIESIGSEMIERIQNPERIERMLNGRFAFLNNQPVVQQINNEDYFVYFDGEYLPPNRGSDSFAINQTDVYVPLWEENTLPIGAIYCLEKEFPNHFLQRYSK